MKKTDTLYILKRLKQIEQQITTTLDNKEQLNSQKVLETVSVCIDTINYSLKGN